MNIKEAQEAAEQKAKELSLQLNTKVLPLVFQDQNNSEEAVIGYIKELPRHVKLAVADKLMVSPVSSCAEVLEYYLIKEQSDQRIYLEGDDNDVYFMGAAMELSKMIKIAVNQIKKK